MWCLFHHSLLFFTCFSSLSLFLSFAFCSMFLSFSFIFSFCIFNRASYSGNRLNQPQKGKWTEEIYRKRDKGKSPFYASTLNSKINNFAFFRFSFHLNKINILNRVSDNREVLTEQPLQSILRPRTITLRKSVD